MAAAPMATAAELREAAQWLADATHIIVHVIISSPAQLQQIGAGAGMSVEAGNDYHDKKEFARLYPGMVKHGFSVRSVITISAELCSIHTSWLVSMTGPQKN